MVAIDERTHEPAVASRPIEDDATAALGLTALLGPFCALLGLLAGLGRLHDNSFFTHLATGRLILDERSVPTVDPYSFTAAGEPWVVQSWLASVTYAVVEDLAGFAGLRVLNGVLVAAIAFLLWTLTARSRSVAVRMGVTTVGLLIASPMLSGRPLLFGTIGFLMVLLAADGRLDHRWMLPVMWVWVNTHGSFPFALLLVGALALGRRLDEGSWGRELALARWVVGGIALGAVNPLGPKLLVFPLRLLTRTEAFESVVEWQPPDYSSSVQYAVLGLFLVAVLALGRRSTWRDGIPLVGFAALGLTSARNQLVMLLVTVVVLSGLLPEVLPRLDALRRSTFAVARVAVAGLAVGAVVLALGQPHLTLSAYPEEATVWMDDEGLWGPESRVVAPDYVGNLRGAQAGRDARVFIDDRVDMFPVELVGDYRVLLDADPGWAEVLERHGATAVLWRSDTPLGEALARDAGWEQVHEDARWVVFVPSGTR